jgi:hypothetical protein
MRYPIAADPFDKLKAGSAATTGVTDNGHSSPFSAEYQMQIS